MDNAAPLPGLPDLAVPRELVPRAGPSAKEDALRARVIAILAELFRGDSGVTVAQGGQGFVVSGAALVASLTAAIDEVVIYGGRTFLAVGNGTADVTVSAGAVGHVIVPETTITAPADGDLIWLWVEISAGIVIDAEVQSGSAIPSDTATEGHTPLATVAVASSIATPTPVAWNYSQVQYCAGQFLWGGFPE